MIKLNKKPLKIHSTIIPKITIFASLSFFSTFIIFSIIWFNFTKIAKENNIIESIQVFLLFIGFTVFSYLFLKNSIISGKLLYLSLSMFYLTFFFREIEIPRSDTLYSIISNPPIRNYWLMVLWAIALIYSFCNFGKTLRSFLFWIRSEPGYFMLTGGVFYLIGDIFDKKLIYINRYSNLFVEELFELNATIFMLLAAIYSLLSSRAREI